MSREILFRGRSIYDNEWHYGDLGQIGGDTWIYGGDDNYTGNKVDPSTVCQYTGLADRNDVKIFENDIVTFAGYSKDNRGWIRFGSYSDARGTADTNYGWFIDFIENNGYYRQDFGYWVNKITVIGNYFDTPELLEGGTGEDE